VKGGNGAPEGVARTHEEICKKKCIMRTFHVILKFIEINYFIINVFNSVTNLSRRQEYSTQALEKSHDLEHYSSLFTGGY
jgi:hypothetical protein